LLLKNAGFYVPDWREGTLPDIDLVAYHFPNGKVTQKYTLKYIEDLVGSSIEPIPNPIILQIKHLKRQPEDFKVINPMNHCIITSAIEDNKEIEDYFKKHKIKIEIRIRDANWVLRKVNDRCQAETKEWLINSFRWYDRGDVLKKAIEQISKTLNNE